MEATGVMNAMHAMESTGSETNPSTPTLRETILQWHNEPHMALPGIAPLKIPGPRKIVTELPIELREVLYEPQHVKTDVAGIRPGDPNKEK